MVYDPTVWHEGTPLNKFEFGDLVSAKKDIKCLRTGIIVIFKGAQIKIKIGCWNPTLNSYVYDVIVNGKEILNTCLEADMTLIQRPHARNMG